MFRKILRFSFIPTSFLFWFLYNGATVENESASGFSIFLLIFLLGIYALIVFNFSLKRFNLKVKARWFFYFFLASTTLILILETVPFFKNFVHTFEFNPAFELFAFLLLASWGISFILSLSFGIKTFFNKKLIRKVDLKKLTHRLRTTKSIALLSLLVVAGFLFGALTQNALFKDFLGIKTNQESVQSSSIAPTSIPTPTSTEVIQEEKYIAPTNDPDPIVDCNFKSLGTKKIRSSECSKSFECQIGGQWYIYTSRDKCTQDQNKQTSNNPQKIIIQYNDPKVPCVGYKGKTEYMPQSECPAYQELGRRLEEAEKNFYTCVNNVESDTTKCLRAILEASRTDIPGCIYCTEEERKTASDKCGEYQKYNTNLCYQTFKTTTDLLKNQ